MVFLLGFSLIHSIKKERKGKGLGDTKRAPTNLLVFFQMRPFIY